MSGERVGRTRFTPHPLAVRPRVDRRAARCFDCAPPPTALYPAVAPETPPAAPRRPPPRSAALPPQVHAGLLGHRDAGGARPPGPLLVDASDRMRGAAAECSARGTPGTHATPSRPLRAAAAGSNTFRFTQMWGTRPRGLCQCMSSSTSVCHVCQSHVFRRPNKGVTP